MFGDEIVLIFYRDFMRHIFYTIFFVGLFGNNAFSQSWIKATPFPNPENSSVVSPNYPIIKRMLAYNGNLYVGGSFNTIGGIVAHGIAKWNGANWSTVGSANLLTDDMINDIINYENKVYFSTNKAIYSYDGTVVSEVKSWNYNCSNADQNDLHVFQNKLYFSSTCTDTIFIFNGISFTEFLDPSPTTNIYSMEDFQNSLYVGTDNGVFKLNSGDVWEDVSGLYNSPPLITDLEEYNGKLVVAGLFESIGGVANGGFQIAQYDGLNWTNFPSVELGYYTPGWYFIMDDIYPISTNSLKIYGGYLYLFGSIGVGAARFNGSSWEILGDNSFNSVHCFEIFNNSLFIGGDFIFDSGWALAKLSSALILEENKNETAINIYPNPTSGSITITSSEEWNNEKFEVYDQSGRKLLAGIISSAQNTIQLPFASGMYYLKIRDEVVKVLKE